MCLVTFFICSVKIKPGLNVVAVCKATLALGLGQCLAATITPTPLYQEVVPNFDVLRAWSPTVLKAPLQ
jgi:hypothetical protein